jgi:hypothetical protein
MKNALSRKSEQVWITSECLRNDLQCTGKGRENPFCLRFRGLTEFFNKFLDLQLE